MTTWIFPTTEGNVEIEWEWNDDIVVRTTAVPQEEVGRISLQQIEGDGHGDEDRWLVTHMFLDGPNSSGRFLRKGIGREIVKSVGEDAPVVFRRDDGQRRDDGSHLTGDGSGFARRMVDDGLAFWEDPD